MNLSWTDVFPEREKASTRFDFQNIVATYLYANGTCKLRDKNKQFFWQHKDPDGTWKPRRGTAPHVLYKAGSAQQTVFICEGEKDADNTSKLGLFAVSSENGAGNSGKKWFPEYNAEISGKDAVLLPDNDKVGSEFMQFIAKAISGKCRSIKVLNLKSAWPELPEKGDISDIIEHFGPEKTKDLLSALMAQTPEWMEQDVFSSFNFYSVPDLSEEDRKPPEFIIDNMLPVGMTFLSGAPKIRKSFLALQIAIAVSTGSSFFGHSTEQCDVVYLDLEGSKSRISARTQRMTMRIPSNVFIANKIQERLSNGLTEKLRALHRQRPNIRLIIIDTYSRARGSPKASGQNAYDADVQFLEPIQRMALEENIAILFVHHDKKGAGFASDSFERISGTMGISGSADAVLNLITEGKRFEGKAKLEFTPRDAKGGELNLVFNDYNTEWQSYEPVASDIKGNPVCNFLINNVPEPRREGQFFTYETVFKEAYRIYAESPGDKIREQISLHKNELFTDYNIAVQTGVKSNGQRGIRVFSVV